MNPYEPGKQAIDSGNDSGSGLLAPRIGIFVGGTLLCIAAASLSYVAWLYLKYPGLTDPPSRPVDYWPEIGAELGTGIAFPAILIGGPLFCGAYLAYRQRQAASREGHLAYSNRQTILPDQT